MSKSSKSINDMIGRLAVHVKPENGDAMTQILDIFLAINLRMDELELRKADDVGVIFREAFK